MKHKQTKGVIIMRQEFLAECKSRKEAQAEATWANWFIKVEGGYRVFESATDYAIFKNQK